MFLVAKWTPFCQNGKVETGPSCVKSIHVNIWFQWNHAKTESDCPGISLWFNQGTIHKVKMFQNFGCKLTPLTISGHYWYKQAAAWYYWNIQVFLSPKKFVLIKIVVTKGKYIFVTEILSRKYSNWLFKRIKFRFPSWFRNKNSVVIV